MVFKVQPISGTYIYSALFLPVFSLTVSFLLGLQLQNMNCLFSPAAVAPPQQLPNKTNVFPFKRPKKVQKKKKNSFKENPSFYCFFPLRTSYKKLTYYTAYIRCVKNLLKSLYSTVQSKVNTVNKTVSWQLALCSSALLY